MSLLVISPCYYPNAYPARFLTGSAAKHNLPLRLYGIGEPFGSPHGGDAQGTNAIRILQESNADVVLSADAPDVILLADEQEILEKFRATGARFVMSAEGNCHPRTDMLLERLGAIPGLHKYINIGLWVAEREYAIECLQRSINLYRHNTPAGVDIDLDNPQAWMAFALAEGTIDFYLDRDCKLFQSMGSSWSAGLAEVREGRIYNTCTDTWPVAIHYNATGNDRSSVIQTYERLYGKL